MGREGEILNRSVIGGWSEQRTSVTPPFKVEFQ